MRSSDCVQSRAPLSIHSCCASSHCAPSAHWPAGFELPHSVLSFVIVQPSSSHVLREIAYGGGGGPGGNGSAGGGGAGGGGGAWGSDGGSGGGGG